MTADSKPDLRTPLAGIPLSSCVYNASGPRSGTAAALKKIAQSGSGAVLTKSATLEAQSGNPQPRTWHSPDGFASFNSEGLPNNGIDYYIDESTIQECMEDAQPHNKPYIVSLSGKSLTDNLDMLKRIASAPSRKEIAAIELNLACPNVIGKPIIAYDFDQMETILSEVSKVSGLPPLGVKLPPYLDFQHFQAAANVLNQHKDTVRYIASINTIGNALAIDGVYSEAPYISSNAGFAGLSGPAVKYTALANVCKFRELLDPSIDVVGVGGISSGKDAYEMLLAGATAVQVATCHWKEGSGCFDRICQELSDLMKQKGYKSVDDIRGKLKPWSKEGAAISRQKTKAAANMMSESSASVSSFKESNSKIQFYEALCGLLVIVVAILCADKWTNVKLLPSE